MSTEKMKKFLKAAALVLCGVIISSAVFLFTDLGDRLSDLKDTSVEAMGAAENIKKDNEMALLDDAYTVAEILRNKDYAALSEWVHPELGVYFIPYSTVNKKENQHFTAQKVREFANNDDTYVWGTVDGEGSPISMTPSEYFERYVYDLDFREAPIIGVNKVVRSGNSLENVKDAFPDADFIELHNPGSSEYNGLNWKSLKLVFEDTSGGRKLVAIIHGEWTV